MFSRTFLLSLLGGVLMLGSSARSQQSESDRSLERQREAVIQRRQSLARTRASLDETLILWQDGHSGQIFDVRFSPDGRDVLTWGSDGRVVIWDAGTGIDLFNLDGHERYVTSAQFSSDGTRIVTASWDKTARIWEIPPTGQGLIDYAYKIKPRDLTDDERREFELEEN